MSQHSAIYVGNVRHYRFEPVVNRFTYSVSMLYLDLDEIESIFDRNWFWSANGFNIAGFRQADHLRSSTAGESQPLKKRVTQFLDSHGIRCTGPIRLITQMRYFGFAMNPASFFFCFDTDENLLAIVTQVNNTPWGEEHLYLIDAQDQNHKTIRIDNLQKDFHVSPFMPMNMQYSMRFTLPEEKLAIRMTNFQSNTRKLDVVMSMSRKKLTPMNLNKLLITYPLMSFKVFAAIYWQALKLWIKKVPFYQHPAKLKQKPDAQTKSHHSIFKASN